MDRAIRAGRRTESLRVGSREILLRYVIDVVPLKGLVEVDHILAVELVRAGHALVGSSVALGGPAPSP